MKERCKYMIFFQKVCITAYGKPFGAITPAMVPPDIKSCAIFHSLMQVNFVCQAASKPINTLHKIRIRRVF